MTKKKEGGKETVMEGREDEITPQQFEMFKDSVRRMVKQKGRAGFVEEMLASGEILRQWEKGMCLYALYLLAITDHLSKLSGMPLYAGYDEIRRHKMEKKIYPLSVIIGSEISGISMDELAGDAVPEFLKYNIVEDDIPGGARAGKRERGMK